MTSRKGIFGYRQTLGKLLPRHITDWFEPSSFLITATDTLPEEEAKVHYLLGKIIAVIAAVVLVFRLTNLQITQGNENRYLAEGNRIRRQVSVAPRGSIVDRIGQSLVSNEPGYSLDLVPSDLPTNKADRLTVYNTVAKELGISSDAIAKMVEKAGLSSLDPIELKPNLQHEESMIYQMKFARVPGVRVSFVPTRQYDLTDGLAHILGYTSRMTVDDLKKHPEYSSTAPIGRSGIESSYDSYLRGTEGVSDVEVNANGQFQRLLQNTPAKIGQTLHLTLDKGLQAEMGAALKEAMDKNQAKQASAVAMNPRTGGILASVSLPCYDNNQFASGITPDAYQALFNNSDRPLLNRTINGLYPAGSTIKPFVAAAALQEGTIKPNTTLDTSAGAIEIGQWRFPDWKVHGMTDVFRAIAESNDIFFYALGGGYDKIPGLGVERLEKYLTSFGFGNSTNVDYASDSDGLIPSPTWKKKVKKESWYIGDTYHMSIGQGDLLVTPLQLARGLSAIVNGGRLITPHVTEAIENPDTGKIQPVTFEDQKLPISQDVLNNVQEGMRRTVGSDTGSARALRALPFSSAGKTGTAQFGTEQKTHAWYIGYAPTDNPEIVISVIVEGGGEGNAISVPVAGRVFSYYMAHK